MLNALKHTQGDERFDSLNELSNLHAIALVCVHRPTQQHPLVMECSLSLPMGLLIDRAVIGSAGLNELAMKETRFFGFIYDRLNPRHSSLNPRPSTGWP
jgi:hypothetical protein